MSAFLRLRPQNNTKYPYRMYFSQRFSRDNRQIKKDAPMFS